MGKEGWSDGSMVDGMWDKSSNTGGLEEECPWVSELLIDK